MLYAKQKLFTFMIAATFLSTTTRSAFTKGVLARNIPASSTTMSMATASSAANGTATTTTTASGERKAIMPADQTSKCSTLIPDISEKNRALLQKHNIGIEPIEPVGARVTGMDLRKVGIQDKPEEVWKALELEMAQRGYLVFPEQGVMTPEEQIHASCLWGGRKVSRALLQ